MTTTALPIGIRSLVSGAVPRLLPPEPLDSAAHQAFHGVLPRIDGRRVIDLVERAGLAGQGGAGFPVHRKMTAVREAARRSGRPAVVVANGSEGEPASAKDKALLWSAPHLVLDGVELAAAAVGADRAFLAVEAERGLGWRLRTASEQRGGSAVPVTVVEVPPRFLSGQESALVSLLNGGPAMPRFQARPVFEDGVDGAPTLLHNVETLAHLALIVRHGPGWYRSGAATTLFTVHRGDRAPAVVEAHPGLSLERLVGPGVAEAQAVLVGGYHGSWLPLGSASETMSAAESAWASPAESATTSPPAAEVRIGPSTPVTADGLGVPLGAGMIAMLPRDRCGIVETASILRFLALESAGQCGPCLNGLPRIAAAFDALADPSPHADLRRIREDLARWAGLVTGRGACRHPDGSARLALSALTTFAAEADAHVRGRCRAPGRSPMLPTGPAEQGA